MKKGYKHILAWKQIIINGIVSNYEVSDDGLIRNIKTNRLLAISRDSKGYLYTSLYMNNQRFVRSIHCLVATAFVPNPENKPVVNHLDSNPENNRHTNLEWCTQKENIEYAVTNGNKPAGEDCSFAKYTYEQIHHVCTLLSENKTPMTKIVGLTGVNYSTIYAIKEGRIWKNVSSLYNIPKPIPNRHGDIHHSSKCNEEQVHTMCQMLMNPLTSFTEIINTLGVKKSDINNVVQGRAWTYISSQYDIPARNRNIRSARIRQLVSENRSIDEITTIIQAEFDMPDRRKARHCVTSNIRYYKMHEI